MPVSDEKESSIRLPSPKKRWGDVAVEKGFITPEQLQDALRDQQTDQRKGTIELIGAVLLRKKCMTREQVSAVDRELQGTSMLAGFEILEKVGQGGMGAVFRARQVSMDRIVALKILPRKLALDPKAKERFFREARLCANMNHLNLINGIDCGEAGGYTFFAMEFVEGETARHFLKKKGRLNQKECVDIIQQIAAALEYAHSKKLVHRDVKPDNIMITPSGVAKLCDLGLTRSVEHNPEDASLTQAGQAVGTPYYISPEQARGEEVDARSDLYSLGATFYHLVAGKPPFEGTAAAVVMAKHLTEIAPPLSDFKSNIDEKYIYIISKMMAKSPEDRYSSARELLDDLALVERGEIPSASKFRGVSTCPTPRSTAFAPAVSTSPKKQHTTGSNAPVGVHGRSKQPQTAKSFGHEASSQRQPLIGLAIGGSIAALLLIGILLVKGSGNTKTNANDGAGSSSKPTSPTAAGVVEPTATRSSPKTPSTSVPLEPFKKINPPVSSTPLIPSTPLLQPTLPDPEPVAKVTPVVPVPIEPTKKPVTPPSVPDEAQVYPQIEIAKGRFLSEVYAKTVKLDLPKAAKQSRELSVKPEYAAVKAYAEKLVREVEVLAEFEQTLCTAIGKLKPQIDLPKEHPFKKNSPKVNVTEFSKGLLQVSAEGMDVGFSLAINTLPPKLVLELAKLEKREIECAQYLLVRGDSAGATAMLASVPEVERNKLQEKIAAIKVGEFEFKAQDCWDSILLAVKNNQWKEVLEKINTFAVDYDCSQVAKAQLKEIESLRDKATESLYPIAAILKAKQCKVLADGFVELEYDFSSADQLLSFDCSVGALQVEENRMKVPAGEDRLCLASFKPRLLELKKMDVIGKSLQERPNRIGILFLTPGQPASQKQPMLILDPRRSTASLVNWDNEIQDDSNANVNFSEVYAEKDALTGREDISLKVIDDQGALKWSVANRAIGQVKIPSKMKGFQLALCGRQGNHSWTGLKLTVKVDPAWLAEQRKKLAEK